jgi:hypothetical protein
MIAPGILNLEDFAVWEDGVDMPTAASGNDLSILGRVALGDVSSNFADFYRLVSWLRPISPHNCGHVLPFIPISHVPLSRSKYPILNAYLLHRSGC